MTGWKFTKGLHDLGNGAWAYLQPDGGWGFSNAGLITDGDESLLVDTLFDENLTAEMLASMKASTGLGGADITTLVNTHANGDHTYGNRLVENAEIITSAATASEFSDAPPALLAQIVENADQLGLTGTFVREIFGSFHFADIELTAPTRTFSGELNLKVGDKPVQLIEVGPAHTKGDTLVYSPTDRAVFTGDILFINGTPIIWDGPISNWIRACDFITELDADIVVPGHGPVTDKAGAQQVRGYLTFVAEESRARFDAGMPALEAAKDIALGPYGEWNDWERLAVNVSAMYREFDPTLPESDGMELFGQMAELWSRGLATA